MPKALQAALGLAARGIRVFPCKQDKTPYTEHGFKDASCGNALIAEWWTSWPGALIGVPTGSVAGLDVLDLDAKHNEARVWWRDNCRRFPRTRMHKTRSGGFHLLFQHNDTVTCTVAKIALGVDTRANGGYVIWWPAAALPVISDAPPAPWPTWLLEEFRSKPQPQSASVVRVPDERLLVRLVQMVAGATEGERNSLTFWCACRAGEMVAEGLLSAETAIAVITEAATRCGLPRAEAERTARSGIARTGGSRG